MYKQIAPKIYKIGVDFLYIFMYQFCSKSIKLYLQKQKRIINEILILYKIVPLIFDRLSPVSFLLVKAPLKLLFHLVFLYIYKE